MQMSSRPWSSGGTAAYLPVRCPCGASVLYRQHGSWIELKHNDHYVLIDVRSMAEQSV